MQHQAEDAPYRILTHGKMTVSSTPLEAPNLAYAGANYNPSTASAAGVTAFTGLHNLRVGIRIKNTHATDALYYGKDSSLTTSNGFSLAAGGILQENLAAGDTLYLLRGGSNDITVEFMEFGYK